MPELESVWGDHEQEQQEQYGQFDNEFDNESLKSNSDCEQSEQIQIDEIYMKIKKKSENCVNKNLDYYSFDLHYPPVYPPIVNDYSYSNIIIPEYNPFKNIMNIRGMNDVYFSIGSEVPKVPTKSITSNKYNSYLTTNNWTPELVNELKYRLSQPNAGLTPTNITSY
jgi:hypothetical protein